VFQIYVTSVLSGCCKNRLGVAHVAMRVKNEGVQAVPVRGLAARARMSARNAGSGEEVLARARGHRSTERTSRRGRPFGCPDASTVTNKSL
jgi:hypothetical protein